jgi:hypothetical protein
VRRTIHDPGTVHDPGLAINEVRSTLETYIFRATCEADLQSQVAAVLETCGHFRVSREVRVVAVRGRYDILVEVLEVDRGSPGADQLRGIRLVLELKVAGTAEAAERQAQRYAQDEGVDAVMVVTSSQKLGRWLIEGGNTLGGKPFAVLTLRSM